MEAVDESATGSVNLFLAEREDVGLDARVEERDLERPVDELVVAHTTPAAYVRFHGRNRQTWFKRTGSTAERFDYLYTAEELSVWARRLREVAAEAETVYAMFNNNGRSTRAEIPKNLFGETEREEIAQAPTNAAMLKELLAA